MAQRYEQLKKSFTLLNELQEDLNKKKELKEGIDTRFQTLKDELEQTKEQRKVTLEKKVLGQATDSDLKKIDSKLQALEKDMVIVGEEFEIINGLQNKTLYDEHDIARGYQEFLSEYRENELLAIEDELRAAKEAYMTKVLEYVEAIKRVEGLKGELVGYMSSVGMRNAYTAIPRFVLKNSKSIFVNPKHLEDNNLYY